jgi:EmrB/QacA subfamily drug resistance transporter
LEEDTHAAFFTVETGLVDTAYPGHHHDPLSGPFDAVNSSGGKTVTLWVTTAASFLTPFMGASANIALPSIGRELSMSAILLGWVAYAFLIAAATVLVPTGRIADIRGRKMVFSLGLFIFSVSSLFCGVAPTASWLIFSRLLQGVGGAMIFGTSIAILTSVFPAGERGRVLGINVASVYLGLSAGPFLGGFLTEHFGWRSIFLINVPMGAAILILVLWKIRGEWDLTREVSTEHFDSLGAALYMAATAAVMYGLSVLTGQYGGKLIFIGFILMTIFIQRERKLQNPLFDMTLFRRNTAFVFSNLAALINYSATFALSFLLSLYLQYINGFSPWHAGLILVVQPIVQALFSPFAGRLSDRIEPRVVASIGMSVTAAGLGLLLLLDSATTIPFIVAVLFIQGLGFALFSAPNTNAIMSSVESRYYGIASGTLATMRLTGQMLSMGMVMLIFALQIGDVQITPDRYPSFLGSMHSALIVMAILCCGGIFASLARGKIH